MPSCSRRRIGSRGLVTAISPELSVNSRPLWWTRQRSLRWTRQRPLSQGRAVLSHTFFVLVQLLHDAFQLVLCCFLLLLLHLLFLLPLDFLSFSLGLPLDLFSFLLPFNFFSCHLVRLVLFRV